MSAHRGAIWWSIWPAMVLKTLNNLSQNGKSIRSMWWWERYFRTALLAALLDMWRLNSVSSWEGVRESEYEAGCTCIGPLGLVSCHAMSGVLWLRSLLRCSIFGKLQQKDRREAPAHKVALGHLDQTFFDKAFLSFPMRLSEDINVVKFHDPNNHPNNHPSSSFIHSFTFVWPWGIQLTESGQSVFGFSESYVASWKDCHQRPMPRSCIKVTRQNDHGQPYLFSAMISSQMRSLTSIWKRRHNAQIRSNKFKWQADQIHQMSRHIFKTCQDMLAFEAWPISCHVSTCLA